MDAVALRNAPFTLHDDKPSKHITVNTPAFAMNFMSFTFVGYQVPRAPTHMWASGIFLRMFTRLDMRQGCAQ